MSEPDPGAEPTVRLHPSSVLFQILRSLRQLIGPVIAAVVLAPGGWVALWVVLGTAAALVPAVVRYLSYRYRLGPADLTVREGILFRSERHIPYARIQNLNLVRNPVHRALGVAEVHVETAGGAKPEAILRVLSLDAVDALRRHAFAERSREETAAGEPEAHELVRLSTGDVALFGFLSNKGMVLVAAAFGALTQAVPDSAWTDWTKRLEAAGFSPAWLDPERLPRAVHAVVVAVIALVLLWLALRVLSIAWGILKYHGFRLVRSGEDLRAEYGLITRITATVPRRRVQLFHVREGFVQRKIGRASVQVETAGSVGGGDDDDKGAIEQVWIAPIVERARVAALLDDVVPHHGLDEDRWQPLSARAFRRVAWRNARLAMLVTALSVPLAKLWSIVVAAVLVAVAVLAARAYVAHARWNVSDTVVAFRSGWWTRRTSVVPFAKMQVVSRVESPFDRRRRMAGVRVDTAGAGRVGHRVDIRYLDGDTAGELHARLADRAAATTFRW